MPAFDPTPAPAGRLVRLGVVLDGASPAQRTVALARMCERAGIDAVWLADRFPVAAPAWSEDALSLGREIAGAMERSTVGVLVDPSRRPVPALVKGILEVQRQAMVPVELGVLGGDRGAAYSRALRAALDSDGGSERPRLSAVAEDVSEIAALLSVVDDIVLPGWRHADLERSADEARAEARENGRDPATLGVAALVTVSIGRTGAEASARADHDPLLVRLGHPAETGIFGTLEECQDRVIALAHAGVTDLRCILPGTADVHDVIAQLTAIAVGTTDVLRPGTLRSPAPPPPEGWGGRPERPPGQRISGGPRRR